MTPLAPWSPGQRLAVDQLETLAADHSGLEVLDVSYDEETSGLTITISVPLDPARYRGGIRLREREDFMLYVGADFPFGPPAVMVRHRRWAGTPHVQWGRLLCLYAAPSTEWVPSDGMRGLVERLLLWLERAATGTLDTGGLPVHPPVAYGSSTRGHLVIRADLGDRVPWRTAGDDGPALLVGLCIQDGERLDVVDWMSRSAYWQQVRAGHLPTHTDGTGLVGAAAVVLAGDIGFEYPEIGTALLAGLEQQGLPRADLLTLMATVADGNSKAAAQRGVSAPADDDEQIGPGGVPQVVIVGTPSREVIPGQRVAHLVAWRVDAVGGKITELHGDLLTADVEVYGDLPDRVRKLGLDWLDAAPVKWARIFEDRAETTHRRDVGSAAAWLNGKRVLVLGCGALGAPVAESVVRAGAADVTVVDNGVISPGILVRQPYDDTDIGQPKARVLAERLRRCRAGAQVHGRVTNAVGLVARLQLEDDHCDLIIDATASAPVRCALEARRAVTPGRWPAMLTLLVGHQARRGIVAVSRPDAAGGGYDVLRRLAIAARTTHAPELRDVAADLFPATPRPDVFLPEPGCSSPTFIGSHAEAAALAAGLLGAGLDALTGRLSGAASLPMAAAACRLQPTDVHAFGASGSTWVGWPDDHVQRTVDGTFQVRISASALTTIQAEARRGARVRGPRVETGGMLLGEVDEAAGVVFVDVATPPTPDSRCSSVHFEHGVDGSQDLVDHYVKTTAAVTSLVGMWHTHPAGVAHPSPTDEAGMANLVAPMLGGPPRCLMLIVGGSDPGWTSWLEQRVHAPAPEMYARVVRRGERGRHPLPQPPAPLGEYFRAGELIGAAPVPWWRRLRGGRR